MHRFIENQGSGESSFANLPGPEQDDYETLRSRSRKLDSARLGIMVPCNLGMDSVKARQKAGLERGLPCPPEGEVQVPF